MKAKLSVITGGSSGLGLATAHCLSSQTAILLCARGAAGLEKAKAELESFGAEVYTYVMDASDAESTRKCAEYAASLGDVVNVIHTAGVSPANTGTGDILRINALGPIHMVEAFYPVLARGGVMICFSSTAGYVLDTNEQMKPLLPVINQIFIQWREPGFVEKLNGFLTESMKLPALAQPGLAYAISKNFVKFFVYSNVWRFAEKECRILSVSPGSYLTPMHQALINNRPESAANTMKSIPLRRWGHPYEMGKLVEFLCSRNAAYITGVDILADGGCTYGAVVPQIDQ